VIVDLPTLTEKDIDDLVNWVRRRCLAHCMVQEQCGGRRSPACSERHGLPIEGRSLPGA
jgi:hypothetical protein